MTQKTERRIDANIKCFEQLIKDYGISNLEVKKDALLKTDCFVVNISHIQSKSSCLLVVCKQNEKDYLKKQLDRLDRNAIIDEILSDLG